MLVRRSIGVVCALLGSGASLARAQAAELSPPGSGASNSVEVRPTSASLVLVALRGDTLDPAGVLEALREELGVPAALEGSVPAAAAAAVVTITYRRDASELTVSWDSGGRTVTRVMAAPPSSDRVIAESALIAGNLARQQVEELLPPEAPRRRAPSPSAPPAAPRPAPPEPAVRPLTAGIFYPLATHYGAPEVTSNFDVNLLYGRVGSVDGAQLGGVNVVRRQASSAALTGVQLGFLANLVHGEAKGVQVAGVFNHSATSAGVQVAMGGNFTGGSFEGLQAASVFNRAGSVSGLQIALVNVAGDVDGVQLGVVNIAARVRGASIGVINIAEDIDGLPLAPFSVTESGGVHPVAWAGSSGLANAGVKLATRRTYTSFFGSYHPAFDLEFLGGGVALGVSVPLGAGFRSDLDVTGTYLVSPRLSYDPSRARGYHEQLVQPRLRIMLAYRLARHAGAFVGLAAMGQIRSELGWDRVSAVVGPEIFAGLEL